MKKGILITLEGNEGCGKSTQTVLLYQFLKSSGRQVFLTREPGGTAIGDAVRAVLLDNKNTIMDPVTETLLYMASRAQLVRQEILPRLRRGEIVLCDRWMDATIAYQGFGSGVDVQWIQSLGKQVTGGVSPALSLFLDLPLKAGLLRAVSHKKADRMEEKHERFHKRARRGYRWILSQEPARFRRIVISEKNTIAEVHRMIKAEVLRVL